MTALPYSDDFLDADARLRDEERRRELEASTAARAPLIAQDQARYYRPESHAPAPEQVNGGMSDLAMLEADLAGTHEATASPDGPDALEAMLGEQSVPTMEQESEGILSRITEYGSDALRALNQGLLVGFGDEFQAGVKAGVDWATGDKPFGEAYDEHLATERGRLAGFREENPWAASTFEAIGAFPTAIAAPGGAMMMPGRSMGARMATGGATTGTYGGVYAYGAGEGDHDERMQSAIPTAGVTGLLGVAAPVVGAGASKTAQYIASRKLAKKTGMETSKGAELVQEAMKADLPGASARLATAGKGAWPADFGPATQNLLDTATQQSGPAGAAARRAVEARANEAARDMFGALDRYLGTPRGMATIETDIRRRSAPGVSAAYDDDVFRQPIDGTSDWGKEVIRIVLKPSWRKAIKEANSLLDLEDVADVPPLKVIVGKDGKAAFASPPTLRQLDYAIRGMNVVAEKEAGKAAIGTVSQKGRAHSLSAMEVRSILRNEIPQYDEALSLAADPIRERAALKLGRDAFGTKPAAELAEDMSGMTAPERAAVAQGYREGLDEKLARVQTALTDPNMDAREAVTAFKQLSTRSNRDKLGMIIGRDAAEAMFGEVERAAVPFQLKAAVATNSRTFGRMDTAKRIEGRSEEGFSGALRSGEPVRAVLGTAGKALVGSKRARQERADAVYTDIVDTLTSPVHMRTVEGAATSRVPQVVGDTVDRAVVRGTGRAPLAGTGMIVPESPSAMREQRILSEYPDAQQAPDGEFYVERNGQFYRVRL